MKNQKQNYLVIGIIVLVGYIVFGPGGNYLKKQNQPLPSPVTTATGTFDNWKTYTNTKLGIEFKYPSQVLVDKNGNINFQNGEYVMGIASSITPETQLHALNPTTLDQVVADKCPNWTDMKSCSDSQPGPLPNSVQFDALNRHFASTNTIVKNGTVIYDISLGVVNPNKPINMEVKKVYNQILSTVKFIATVLSDKTIKAIAMLEKNRSILYIQRVIQKNGTKAFFSPGEVNGDIVTIWFYEGGFPDQHTTRIDTFMVNTKTGEILVDDVVNNKIISLKDWGMNIIQRFPDYGPQKTATVLVQDGSSYGPPFDQNLYQLEISKSEHLFAKSDLIDLKKYLGKTITVNYREVRGVIMSEQQLVTVDSVE